MHEQFESMFLWNPEHGNGGSRFLLEVNVFDLVMGHSLVMGHFLHSVSHQ